MCKAGYSYYAFFEYNNMNPKTQKKATLLRATITISPQSRRTALVH